MKGESHKRCNPSLQSKWKGVNLNLWMGTVRAWKSIFLPCFDKRKMTCCFRVAQSMYEIIVTCIIFNLWLGLMVLLKSLAYVKWDFPRFLYGDMDWPRKWQWRGVWGWYWKPQKRPHKSHKCGAKNACLPVMGRRAIYMNVDPCSFVKNYDKPHDIRSFSIRNKRVRAWFAFWIWWHS